MKIKSFLFWLSFVLILSQVPSQSAKATVLTMTTKEFLNFEILDINLNQDNITIQGWAFLNENQHFKTPADHAIRLEFISQENTFIVDATLTNFSMTSAYEQSGLSMCADGVYFETQCNYYFEYVGFTATIPMSSFRVQSRYITNLIFLAYNSQTYLKTPLYFPIPNPLTTQLGDFRFSVISDLHDTQLRIIETPVYVRKGAGKTATVWTGGTNCSMTYGNRLYYKFGSIFTNVISKLILDNQTYYELGGKLDACVDLRRRIVEGSAITPAWIPGVFVEYSGSPLEISSVLINTNPVILAEDFTILLNQPINLLDYAKSFDAEDGDISNKMIVEASELINKVGSYRVTYYVEDKYKYFDRKTIIVSVNSPLNDPPIINAMDQRVQQYSIFDAKSGVTAVDIQDGDLTERIQVMNSIDTAIIGPQEQCYQVTDNLYAKTTKCIVIDVYSPTATTKQYRSVSKNHLFYQETEPRQWNGKTTLLLTMLLNQIVLKSIEILPK